METVQTNAPSGLWEEVDRRLAALTVSQQETDRLIKEQSKETQQYAREAREREKERERERERERKEHEREREEREREREKERAREAGERKKEADQRAREADQRAKETDQRTREAEQRLKEAEQRARETDKKLNKLETLFTSQWGRLVESLVEGDLVSLLNQRGIPVANTSRRVRGSYNGQNYEFDILAVNGEAVVVIEVKTTLRPDDVAEFIQKLDQFKVWKKEYAGNTVHGGVAFIQADGQADRMAEKRGLFVIRATGSSAAIVNQESFHPQAW